MGVKKIETVGTEFDYNTHMAISTEPSDEYDCWLSVSSTQLEDSAPPASRDYLKAQAAPPYLRAPPEQLGGLPSSQELASGRPNLEESPLSTTRYEENIVCEEMQPGYTCDDKLVRAAYVKVSAG